MIHVLPTRRSAIAAIGLSLVPCMAVADRNAEDPLTSWRSLQKAAWLWGFDPRQARDLNEFSLVHGISTLFVSMPSHLRVRLLDGDFQVLDGLRRLADGGIRTWALAGDPSWAEQPERIAAPLQQLLDFQDRFELFHGLHLDVEPHTLPSWQSSEIARVELAEKFVSFLQNVAACSRPLPLEAALHPSLARIRLANGKNALLTVCKQLASTSIMAYRDTAAGTLSWATPTLDLLAPAQIPWRIGVLVHPSTEARISFHGMPARTFIAEMIELNRMLSDRYGQAGYRGLAFEDFAGLHKLLSLPQLGGAK